MLGRYHRLTKWPTTFWSWMWLKRHILARYNSALEFNSPGRELVRIHARCLIKWYFVQYGANVLWTLSLQSEYWSQGLRRKSPESHVSQFWINRKFPSIISNETGLPGTFTFCSFLPFSGTGFVPSAAALHYFKLLWCATLLQPRGLEVWKCQ